MSNLEVTAAYDLKPIRSLPMQDEEIAMAMMDKAQSLFNDRSRWIPAYERISILEKTIELIKIKRQELALEAAKEGGKPLIDSLVEVDRAMGGIKVAIEELSHMRGTEIPMGITKSSENRLAYTRRVPRGVVVAISAFNHPFNLIIHQVIPALAVGCPVIVKPAATTPLSCQNLVNILYEAGLPKDWCQMVICENEVAEKLVRDPRNAFLTFIGSAKVGWYLRSKLPPGASCALEHGGAAPVIVDKSADLEKCIPLLVKGGYYHAGQVCVSVQRIFVHEDIKEVFIQKFVAATKKLKVGDPTAEDTEVGPLILPREVDRVHSWVENALASGGELLCGGKKISNTCYEPTAILNPGNETELSNKEVFGPVCCLYSFTDTEEAIKRANNVEYSFQAALFTNDLAQALTTADKLEGMAIMINDHTAFRVDWMPFGGHKQSGLGVGGIGYSMEDMTLEKLVVFKQM